MGQRNLALLHEVGQRLFELNRPFVIAADWNCSPAEVEATGLPQLLAARVVAPSEHTCFHAGSASTLDFFVVHSQLVERIVEVAVQEDLL
eukprot:12388257-Alexandrium_andersonii.AAC.1